MKIVTIVGARPQFIKARPLSYALREKHQEILVHTGQHYDPKMSGNFFADLEIPEPDYNLGIGGGSHGEMTAAMLSGIEKVLLKENPDLLIVYGDTNSTIAGALAASKLHIPVAHVEAGLRSFNRKMPEEVNRVVTDHLSNFLFAPSEDAKALLEKEGITNGVFVVGDIMYDAVLLFRKKAERQPYLKTLGLEPKNYYLCTLHRAENVDSKAHLSEVLSALSELQRPVLFPCHPRTEKMIKAFDITLPKNFIVTEPTGYLEMLQAEENAICVLTDSGGVQKEAFYLGTPCVTLRTETEWRELVQSGWNIVSGLKKEAILDAVNKFEGFSGKPTSIYGNGDSARLILEHLSVS